MSKPASQKKAPTLLGRLAVHDGMKATDKARFESLLGGPPD